MWVLSKAKAGIVSNWIANESMKICVWRMKTSTQNLACSQHTSVFVRTKAGGLSKWNSKCLSPRVHACYL